MPNIILNVITGSCLFTRKYRPLKTGQFVAIWLQIFCVTSDHLAVIPNLINMLNGFSGVSVFGYIPFAVVARSPSLVIAKTSGVRLLPCHCEERSDEVISWTGSEPWITTLRLQ